MNAATGQEKTRSPREAPGAPGALLRLEGQPPAVADPATITRAGRTSSVTSFCVDKRAAHLARDSMRGTSFGIMDPSRPSPGGVLRPLTNCSAVPFSCTSYRDNGLGALRAWKRAPTEPAMSVITCGVSSVRATRHNVPRATLWVDLSEERLPHGMLLARPRARSAPARRPNLSQLHGTALVCFERLASIRTDPPVKTIPTEDELREELETGDARRL